MFLYKYVIMKALLEFSYKTLDFKTYPPSLA